MLLRTAHQGNMCSVSVGCLQLLPCQCPRWRGRCLPMRNHCQLSVSNSAACWHKFWSYILDSCTSGFLLWSVTYRNYSNRIVFEWIQFSETTCSYEALLAKQNGKSWQKWVCLVYQEALLSKQRLWSTGRGMLWWIQTVFLSKQVPTIVAANGKMLRRSNFSELIHF